MKMFSDMLKGGEQGADGGSGGQGQNDGSAEMFKQFSQFLENSEKEFGGDEFKGLLDSVVKDILSKDSLYKPMKVMKDEYPDWLEKNWEGLSTEDLERYNQQMDKINEICELFEKQGDADGQPDGVFEMLT